MSGQCKIWFVFSDHQVTIKEMDAKKKKREIPFIADYEDCFGVKGARVRQPSRGCWNNPGKERLVNVLKSRTENGCGCSGHNKQQEA